MERLESVGERVSEGGDYQSHGWNEYFPRVNELVNLSTVPNAGPLVRLQ